MIITWYAVIAVVILLTLSARVIYLRTKLKVSLGDAGQKDLQAAIRGHANFTEYVPLALFLLFLIEFQSGNLLVIYTLGTALVIGRLLHSYAFWNSARSLSMPRMVGMILTFTVLAGEGMYLLYLNS